WESWGRSLRLTEATSAGWFDVSGAPLGAALRRQRNLDKFVAAMNTDSKIDRSRAAGRHRSTVHSWLGQSAHPNLLHAPVSLVCDEHDAGDLHGLAGGVQETHGVRIAPSPRYRPEHELCAKRVR